MRIFTPTEIDLCKKIAEKERKKIEYGDFYLVDKDIILCAFSNKAWHQRMEKEIIPLWQEHDAMEWLRARGCIIRLSYQKGVMKKDIEITESFDAEFTKIEIFIKGYNFMEKPLEWLLRAVLAVMEGSG